MNKKNENKKERKAFYIPIDGILYETSEEVYTAYYRMDRRERYLDERSRKHELSLETLSGSEYPVENKMVEQPVSLEDEVITGVMIESLLKALTTLSEEEKWLINELFFCGKSERELSAETGVPRKTISYRKEKVLNRLKKVIKN
ncbi:sigma-70 family RNA polymerase sigma factor [Fusibacter ferrireducens]|uniref:Sigma-70 family RNA polymerase sigma factor n=1 Tax=Fusibacter ferrireducens TaxID=2785058 RepID=A0ABR9ZWE1_9FIRM|nr:sigma-70 family RNA polymerase sigma factor [Fusibacter ferrireducens]MBF4694763.1 sigma-70 family RNA polymerase sigma factor [Fusibacter ferrireducens]